jgi:hypothetical protein
VTNNGAHLPESEDYHSALTWLDEGRDELSLLQTRRKRSGFALPRSLCLATALLLATPLAVRGQSLRQLYHRSWTVREGAPSSLTSIAQSIDCFLWLGTDNGMVRFDGESLEPYHPPSGEDLL